MWTYMMAAARGDRATSMLSSRRRNDTDSPGLSRSFPYGFNRTTRLHGTNFGTGNLCSSNYHQYPYNNTGHQIFHTASHSNPATKTDSKLFKSRREQEEEEDIKLFASISMDKENELNPNKKSLSNHLTGSKTKFTSTSLSSSSQLSQPSTSLSSTAVGTTTVTAATETTATTLITATTATITTTAPVAKITDGVLSHGRVNNRISSIAHDDDDGYPSENIIEEGKSNQQESQKRTKPSALRRTLNALRYRITKRGRTKPPDWFLDKFSNATDGKISGDVPSQEITNNRLCNRLSVDPSLPSHYRWLAIVSLAVLYNVIFVVGRAVFWEINRKATPLWLFLDYLCDFIYLTDTLVHMHEGYLEQGLLVRDAYKLRKHYFSTKGWRLDVLSMFPTDIVYIWWNPNSCNATVPCPVIVRLNRLLRLPRMWEWFDRTETATGYPNAFRICKVVLAILVLIHWNACLYFAISYALGFGTDNWVYNLNGTRNATLSRQYIYSFYWSTLTLTTIGETPTPENDAEYLFVVADFLAGVLIFATIVGNIGSMISNMNVARVEFQNRMDGVKQYMAFRRVGHELEARVIRWFAYTWSQSGALDEERVLAALPDKLKAEIAIRVHMDTLKQVRIFQDCEPGLLEALVLKLKLQVFSPGDFICRKGDVGKEMYIVKRGRLSVVADDGITVLATLGAGSVFGEVSVLEIAGNRTGNRRTANVRSLGYSDLFCLAKRDLWETLADYPEARASLTERGCQLLRKDGLLDEEVFANAQQEQDSLENGVQKLENAVENLNLRLARLLAEYSASQAKLKQRIAKLELLSAISTSNNLEDDVNNRKCPRTGRLYSLQTKRKRSRIPSSASNTSKQNTL